MAQMTPQVQERGMVIDRLIASLDEEPAEEGVEEAWAEGIKRRVDDIDSGKAKMIPWKKVRRRLATRLLGGK